MGRFLFQHLEIRLGPISAGLFPFWGYLVIYLLGSLSMDIKFVSQPLATPNSAAGILLLQFLGTCVTPEVEWKFLGQRMGRGGEGMARQGGRVLGAAGDKGIWLTCWRASESQKAQGTSPRSQSKLVTEQEPD